MTDNYDASDVKYLLVCSPFPSNCNISYSASTLWWEWDGYKNKLDTVAADLGAFAARM